MGKRGQLASNLGEIIPPRTKGRMYLCRMYLRECTFPKTNRLLTACVAQRMTHDSDVESRSIQLWFESIKSRLMVYRSTSYIVDSYFYRRNGRDVLCGVGADTGWMDIIIDYQDAQPHGSERLISKFVDSICLNFGNSGHSIGPLHSELRHHHLHIYRVIGICCNYDADTKSDRQRDFGSRLLSERRDLVGS